MSAAEKTKEPKKRQLIASGIYRARLIETKNIKAKNKRPMKQLQWEIVNDYDFCGRKIKSYIAMDSEPAKKLLEVIILNMGGDPKATRIEALCGEKCNIQIEEKTTQFGEINSINYYLPDDEEENGDDYCNDNR